MRRLNNKAFSIVEYAVLFIIVIGAFVLMKSYIQRGLFGSWAQAGKGFSFGRQYDPQKTIECAFDDQTNQWYDRNCFKNSGCTLGDYACESTCKANTCGTLNSDSY